jgi:hypothetical protein
LNQRELRDMELVFESIKVTLSILQMDFKIHDPPITLLPSTKLSSKSLFIQANYLDSLPETYFPFVAHVYLLLQFCFREYSPYQESVWGKKMSKGKHDI